MAEQRSGPTRRHCLAAGTAALLALGSPARPRAQPSPLRVALVPYLSPRAMLTQFEPLRGHLQGALGRPVDFHTAASFGALLDSVRRREQPFTFLPMHLARIAVADWGDTLVAKSTRESMVQLLSPSSLGLGRPETLRGRTIGAIDPLSITTLLLRRWLRDQGLEAAVTLVHLPNASAAAKALAMGEVQAIAAAQGQTLDIPWVRPDTLSVLAELGSVLTPCFVAHRQVPAAEVAAFRQAVLGFSPAQATRGASGAVYSDAKPRDLEPYEPFAEEVRRLLGEAARRR